MYKIGIAGPSSVGKTTLAKNLQTIIPEMQIVHQDEFYKAKDELPTTENGRLILDAIESFDLPAYKEYLEGLNESGIPFVAEGLYAFDITPEFFDHRIYLDAPLSITFDRRPAHYENDAEYQKIITDMKTHIDRQRKIATRVIRLSSQTSKNEVFEIAKTVIGV